jgi:hypothetical protein
VRRNQTSCTLRNLAVRQSDSPKPLPQPGFVGNPFPAEGTPARAKDPVFIRALPATAYRAGPDTVRTSPGDTAGPDHPVTVTVRMCEFRTPVCFRGQVVTGRDCQMLPALHLARQFSRTGKAGSRDQ